MKNKKNLNLLSGNFLNEFIRPVSGLQAPVQYLLFFFPVFGIMNNVILKDM